MQENLISFAIVVTVQLVFFLIHAYSVGEVANIRKYLLQGTVLGLPFGIFFDVVILHGFGIAEYYIGIPWWFLVINGIFSYGFMIANVFLLKHHNIIHMYLWSVGLGVVYEVTNYFLPVWNWTFSDPAFEYVSMTLVGYAGLTAFMMLCMRLSYKFHFRLLPF